MGTDSPHHFPSKKLGKVKPSDLTNNLESAKSFDEKVQLSKNSLGLGERTFGRETLPHKLPHFPTLGSWYNKYRSGQEHRKMSLSCHPSPPQYEDYSFQSSVFWKSPLFLASSPLPLLPLFPRQRSRIPGGGREGCWEVGTAIPGPNRRLEQQFQARRDTVASSPPREQRPWLGSQRMGQR